MGKTLQEILDLCQEKDIQIVDFKMTDIDGRWRHLSIPVGRLNATWFSCPTWILPQLIPLQRFPPSP